MEVWRCLLLLEDQQRRDETLEAEQVVAIGRDVDPVDDILGGRALDSGTLALLLGHHLLLAGHLVQLQAEGKAQLLELVIG